MSVGVHQLQKENRGIIHKRRMGKCSSLPGPPEIRDLKLIWRCSGFSPEVPLLPGKYAVWDIEKIHRLPICVQKSVVNLVVSRQLTTVHHLPKVIPMKPFFWLLLAPTPGGIDPFVSLLYSIYPHNFYPTCNSDLCNSGQGLSVLCVTTHLT